MNSLKNNNSLPKCNNLHHLFLHLIIMLRRLMVMPDSPILKIIIWPTAIHRPLTIIINSILMDLMGLNIIRLSSSNKPMPLVSSSCTVLTRQLNTPPQVSLIPLLLSLLNRMWKSHRHQEPRQPPAPSSRAVSLHQKQHQENQDGDNP